MAIEVLLTSARVMRMPYVARVGEMTLTSDIVSTRNLLCVYASLTKNR